MALSLTVSSVHALPPEIQEPLQEMIELSQFLLPREPPWDEPFEPRNSTGTCAEAGLECKAYTVPTVDGYLLNIVHIKGQEGNPPVLLQHGFIMTSDGWLMRRDQSNIAQVLARAGFDVWMPNFRGNTYSRKHRTLDPDRDKEFWDYSFDDHGMYDVSASIDFILRKTKAKDLHTVCHSMGCAAITVLLATRPDYNKKVRLATMMAPVLSVSKTNSTALYRFLFSFSALLKEVADENGVKEILPRQPYGHLVANYLCLQESRFLPVCDAIYELLYGKTTPSQRIPDRLATLAAFVPAGATFKILEHYSVVGTSGKFRPAGRGLYDKNPGPEYRLGDITTPMAFYYGKTDGILFSKDLERWIPLFRNVVRVYMVPLEYFNHMDFMLAKDVDKLLYQPMIQTMKEMDRWILSGNRLSRVAAAPAPTYRGTQAQARPQARPQARKQARTGFWFGKK